jgi:hypothetical protein
MSEVPSANESVRENRLHDRDPFGLCLNVEFDRFAGLIHRIVRMMASVTRRDSAAASRILAAILRSTYEPIAASVVLPMSVRSWSAAALGLVVAFGLDDLNIM